MSGEKLGRPPTWTERDHDKLLEMFRTGSTIAEMAEAFGRTKSAVSTKLRTLRIYRGVGINPHLASNANSEEYTREQIIAMDDRFQLAMRKAILAGKERMPIGASLDPKTRRPIVYNPPCSSIARGSVMSDMADGNF